MLVILFLNQKRQSPSGHFQNLDLLALDTHSVFESVRIILNLAHQSVAKPVYLFGYYANQFQFGVLFLSLIPQTSVAMISLNSTFDSLLREI